VNLPGSAPLLRMYDDLARWWPLLSPPDEYEAEAADLLDRLPRPSGAKQATLLELGSGGGSLAFHLKRHFRMTLTDISGAMLDVSRAINGDCEHLQGDMRSLRLGRQFDVVLIHDAIMYARSPADVRGTLHTAELHCSARGTVVVLPDYLRETFEPGVDCGGHDAPDGRGLRYLEWRWDPDPVDDTYLVHYAFLLREVDGTVRVEHDRHEEGLFARADWLTWFREAGFEAHVSLDSSGREILLAVRDIPLGNTRETTKGGPHVPEHQATPKAGAEPD
jgi:SAM-dependent methyltransferase